MSFLRKMVAAVCHEFKCELVGCRTFLFSMSAQTRSSWWKACVYSGLSSLIHDVVVSSCLDWADSTFVPTTRFFVCQQVNLRGPLVLALGEIKSRTECWDFHVGARVKHSKTHTHTKMKYLSENEADSPRKGTNDFSITEATSKRDMWLMHHFCSTKKIILQVITHDSIEEISRLWVVCLEHFRVYELLSVRAERCLLWPQN